MSGWRLVRRWFLPRTPDLLAVLQRQGQVTAAGMEAFARWSRGAADQEGVVRRKEHEADAVRRELMQEITRVFVAPLGPEDIFELSERLDVVLNAAKNVVREAEVLAMPPNDAMAEMAEAACQGVHHLVTAFPHLRSPESKDEASQATHAADAAIHQQRTLERVYRRAMSALLEVDEFREVVGRRELYRRYARMGDAIEAVADRIWYAVVKSS